MNSIQYPPPTCNSRFDKDTRLPLNFRTPSLLLDPNTDELEKKETSSTVISTNSVYSNTSYINRRFHPSNI